MRRILLISCLSVMIATFIAPRATAQNYLYSTGNQTWGINIPIENGFINVANGEVHIEIPIATLPQRGGLPLDEKLVYDSRIWQIVYTGSAYAFEPTNVPSPASGVNPICTGTPQAACTSTTPGTVGFTYVNVPNSMAGWRFMAGNETGILQGYISGEATNLDQQSEWNWGWTDPSGTLHYFPFTTGTVWCPSCGPESASGYATDGSGFSMNVTNYNSAIVYDASGNEVYPQVIDRNGNNFSLPSGDNLVDALGRTPVQVSTSGNQIFYDVLTIGGATKRYTVTTETINVNTAFNQSGTNDYSGTLTAIASLALPDGTSYTFNYDSGTASGNYGELESVTLPTGGTVSLSYANYLDSYQNENRWLSAYSGGKGAYTFAPSVVTQCQGAAEVGCQEQMQVTDAADNYVLYLLTLNDGAWNSQMSYYQGDSEREIMSTTTTYTFSNSTPSWMFEEFGINAAEWVTASNITTTLSDTGQNVQTQYTYAYPWSGKPSTVKRWDYFTGSPSATPTKETDISYGTLVNNAYFPTQISQLGSNGNLAAQTVLTYDQGSPATASGATNLLPAPGGASRGNLTGVTSGIGTTVSTSSTYDTAGMKLTDVDGKNYTTNYSYSCSDAYVGTVTLPVVVNGSNLQTQTGYDCSSGLVTSTKDPNGVVYTLPTSSTYFTSGTNIGKLETVTYPDTGSTSYAYPSATETDVTTAQNTSVNVLSKQIVDSFGRKYQTVTVAPEGSISSETTYDPTGYPNAVTTAHLQGASSPTDGTTYASHDMLGRPTVIGMPDGNTISHSYTGATDTITDELGHSKEYSFDAFHRLTSVLEPNSSGTLAFETDYQYNAVDQLTEVDQWGGAKGATSPGDRQRVFAYDSLGRQIAENIPENQSALSPASLTCAGTTSGTVWTTCYGYDPNGNITSTNDNAGNALSYTYDPLNRLLTESQSPSGLSYTYEYDGTDGNTHTYPLGYLTYSANNNALAGSSLSYDSMGRLTNQNNCVPTNCTYGTSGINVAAKYDLAGNMIQLTYPDGRVVQPTFDADNRLTGVNYTQFGSTSVGTSYFATSKFAPPGQPITSEMGNGVGITASFNNRQSIASLTYATSSSTLWAKNYQWDKNAANLLILEDGITGYARQFTYDTLNRVTTAQDIGYDNPGTKSTGTVTIAGSDVVPAYVDCKTPGDRATCTEVYNSGLVEIIVNGVNIAQAGYEEGTTAANLASSLEASINSNSNSPVTASVSGDVITLTSINGGSEANVSLSTSVGYDGTYFSSSSFSATTSGSSMTGGSAGAPSPALNETYMYDAFGNLTDSGTYGFSQSFNAYNQITGYSYDADGDQNTDIYSHALAFDANGMLSSVAGATETYVYDAQGNRAEVHGSTVTDSVYFGSMPVALITGGAYTDLIYAGGTLIAEVGGTETAAPTYRVTDNLSTLGGSLSSSGLFSSPINYGPYGEQFSGTTSDPYGFTGMQWDPTTATNHATFRQFSIQQSRWQSPDPYSGSYNWADPQSLNRYAYVNDRPMWATDPSGLDGGFGGIYGTGVSCTGAAAQGGINIEADAYCGLSFLLSDLFGGGSNFHGSLKPRPSANPWDDKFGVPYGGLTNGIQQALGLPTIADIGCNPICDATGGGSSVIDPNYSSCMSSFYGSGFGKGVEFASPLSMIPGWDPRPGQNIFENVILFGGKMLGLKSLSGAGGASLSSLNTTSTIASPMEGFVGAGAKGALKLVGKIGPWVWGTGAFIDTMKHTGCALGQQRSASMANFVAM